jgi:hypothetical protein
MRIINIFYYIFMGILLYSTIVTGLENQLYVWIGIVTLLLAGLFIFQYRLQKRKKYTNWLKWTHVFLVLYFIVVVFGSELLITKYPIEVNFGFSEEKQEDVVTIIRGNIFTSETITSTRVAQRNDKFLTDVTTWEIIRLVLYECGAILFVRGFILIFPAAVGFVNDQITAVKIPTRKTMLQEYLFGAVGGGTTGGGPQGTSNASHVTQYQNYIQGSAKHDMAVDVLSNERPKDEELDWFKKS